MTVGRVIKNKITKAAKEAIRDLHYVQNVKVHIHFLAVNNIMEGPNNVLLNAQTITDNIKRELAKCELDGASVMVGKNSSMSAPLKRKNPRLINIQCTFQTSFGLWGHKQ